MSNVESVKVAVRVRPFNGREKDQKSTCIVKVQSSPKYVCAALPTPTLCCSPADEGSRHDAHQPRNGGGEGVCLRLLVLEPRWL